MNRLNNLLESQLGTATFPKESGKQDAKFYCPFCHHKKKKLYVNLEWGYWHCWTCESKSRNPRALLQKIGTSVDIQIEILSHFKQSGSKKFDYDIFSSKEKILELFEPDVHESINFLLPKEFIPLYIPRNNDFTYNRALHYAMKERKFTFKQLIKYNIGYCEEGEYKDRLIIPSYDENFQLNYFIGRSFFDNTMKYKNPRVSKDILAFENHVNWDFPIILVEGLIDAIKVGVNAVPLLGKIVQPKLKSILLKPNITTIYIGLDKDAIKQSLNILEFLLSMNKTVYLIQYPDDKDFGDMNKQEIHQRISEAKKLNYEDLIKLKLKF